MKPCPYCAELIQDQAVKCRYCGEWLDPSKRPAWSDGAVPVAPVHTPAPASARAPEPMPLDDEPARDTSATLPVGSGLSDITRPEPEPARTWSAPAWLANAQAARADQREVEVAPTDRSTLEEVALRMERIRQSAAAVRETVDPAPRAVRPASARASEPAAEHGPDRAVLEVEPGVTLAAGSLRAVGLPDRARTAGAPQPAPVVREDDDFGDYDDRPSPRRRRDSRQDLDLSNSERPTIPDIPRDQLLDEPERPRRRRGAPAREEADDRDHDLDQNQRNRSRGRRRISEPEAMPPAPAPASAHGRAPADDFDDDFDDELPPPRAAGAGFDEGFLDDDDGHEGDDDDFDDFGAPGPASPPLPWRPILLGAAVIVVAGVFLFRDYLFPSDPEVDEIAEEAEAGDAGETKDEAKDEAKAQPPVEDAKEPDGEGQPVEPETKADGGEVPVADGGVAVKPPAPAALDPATLAKLDEARKAYESANGSSSKLKPVGEKLQEILTTAPDHPEALTLMAQVYLEQGKLDESLSTSNRCTEVSPESSGCWLTIGVIQEAKGAKDVARVAYQKYLELAPEGRYAKDARKALGRLK